LSVSHQEFLVLAHELEQDDDRNDDLISVPLESERFSRSIFELMRETRGIEHGYASAEINSVYDDSVGWGEGRPERPLYLLLRQSHFTRQGEATIYSRNFYVEGAFKFSIMRIS